ncbi:MAG: hypothetical protein KDC34_19740 [Saprospiraceae bacterium]|nr:hypothetical protein [Saprospiraceae bacterium]
MFLLFLSGYTVNAQEDLLSLLEEEPTVNYTSAAFKTNRVINLHSIEHTAKGVLDFKISHRFGFLNGGFYELFGLDNASIRLGLDYGITDRIQIGWGRSSFEKTYDGYAKLKLLRQSTGARKMPISASIFGSMAVQTLRWPNPDRENLFTSRLYYTTQVIIGSKINDNLSLQVSPTLVHRNLVATTAVSNDVYAIGFAGRVKITSRLAINAEYIFVLPDQISPDYRNSISLGIDLETGGHVFQLHFTNSTSMIEKGFITETVGNWADGGVHFGFNVSRVFTVVKPKFD